jgi:hypothetical protein
MSTRTDVLLALLSVPYVGRLIALGGGADGGCARRLVIESLEPLAPERTCHRLINGVLVQMTVGEVLPSLRATRDGVRTNIMRVWHPHLCKRVFSSPDASCLHVVLVLACGPSLADRTGHAAADRAVPCQGS